MRVYDHFPNPDCKGYTILNIHGYHGSPKNSAYTALHEIRCEYIISHLLIMIVRSQATLLVRSICSVCSTKRI